MGTSSQQLQPRSFKDRPSRGLTGTAVVAHADSTTNAIGTEPSVKKSNESDLWLPPIRLRRYQRHKMLGGLLIAAIFTGWMINHWSNPWMRRLCLLLFATTAWVVIKSHWADRRRAQDRQLAVDAEGLSIWTSKGKTHIRFQDIAAAQWREEPTEDVGLWLYDHDNQVLAHLDAVFFADQAETRSFLQWARERAPIDFPVHWPR